MNTSLSASVNRMTAVNPRDAKAGFSNGVGKNEKAARDFEAMLLAPVFESLQKTFAGDSEDSTAPFVTGASPSGIVYVGNTDVNQVSIGSGYNLAVNLPGSQLFSATGNDVFLAINNLIQAVQNNTGIPAAINAISAASGYLSAQRVFYGNALNQATSQTTYLNTAKLQLSAQQTTLGGADIAAAATSLAQAQTDTQAALAAISKFSQNNLFDYLH